MKDRALAREVETAAAMVLLWIALFAVLVGLVIVFTDWL
jgi:hypothetical protein